MCYKLQYMAVLHGGEWTIMSYRTVFSSFLFHFIWFLNMYVWINVTAINTILFVFQTYHHITLWKISSVIHLVTSKRNSEANRCQLEFQWTGLLLFGKSWSFSLLHFGLSHGLFLALQGGSSMSPFNSIVLTKLFLSSSMKKL